MLEDRFGFGKSAGTFYALPYIISGVMSPILGIIIDKNGKRALFSKCPFFLHYFITFHPSTFLLIVKSFCTVMFSSVFILLACVITTLI